MTDLEQQLTAAIAAEFLHGIRSWPNPLTEKQSRMLKAIAAKVSAEKEAA